MPHAPAEGREFVIGAPWLAGSTMPLFKIKAGQIFLAGEGRFDRKAA
jgi:hypothetical protein